MATVPRRPRRQHGSQRLVLDAVPWQSYLHVLKAFDERHLRITYDRGTLELMTLSPEHERAKHLIGRLILALTEELDWALAGYGSMTFKRRSKQRGLEPDECYWIQHEPLMRGKKTFDIRIDPPPDLVVEIDVTHSSVDRMAIYAALRVPEVWRYKDQELQVYLLTPEGHYIRSETSRAFPFLRPAELLRFLALEATEGETGMVRAFRAWVREQQALGWPAPAPPPPPQS